MNNTKQFKGLFPPLNYVPARTFPPNLRVMFAGNGRSRPESAFKKSKYIVNHFKFALSRLTYVKGCPNITPLKKN